MCVFHIQSRKTSRKFLSLDCYYIPTAIISQPNNCSSHCLPLIHFVTARINPDSSRLKILKWCLVHFLQHKVETHRHLRPSVILILLTSSTLSLDTSSCFSPLALLWTLSNTPTFSSFKSQHVGILTFSETLYLGIPLCDYITPWTFPFHSTYHMVLELLIHVFPTVLWNMWRLGLALSYCCILRT